MYSCRVSSEPAYTRLSVEARRRQLLKLGADLFARHSLDELSMAVIAREAGISKALLYHYFPSKADFFEATLRAAAEELGVRTEPDPDLPPAEALAASLDAETGVGGLAAHPATVHPLLTAGQHYATVAINRWSTSL